MTASASTEKVHLTETEFHNAVHAFVGTPTPKYTFIGAGKTRRRQAVDKKHACSWVESIVDLSHYRIHTTIYLNIESNTLPQQQFNRLKQLIQTGIGQYWSRKTTIGKHLFIINSYVKFRPKNAVDVNLKIEKSGKYARSHNSGIIAPTFIFNEGYFYSKPGAADKDFQLVSAHEFGHSVLEYLGGKKLSWGHKGSTHALFQSVKSSTPGYPKTGEIDLMKYFDKDKQGLNFYDLTNRSIVAEQDILRLIWMSKISFKK